MAAMGFFGTRDFAAVLKQAQATLDLEPDYWWAHFFSGVAFHAT